MKKILMLGAAVLTMQALPALAEEGGKKPPRGEKMMEKMFEHQDTDKDGTITKEESIANANKRFEEMDTNKDGKLTKDEIKAHHEAKRAEWKARKEARGDDVPPPPPGE